jgi:hypothetical protein
MFPLFPLGIVATLRVKEVVPTSPAIPSRAWSAIAGPEGAPLFQ